MRAIGKRLSFSVLIACGALLFTSASLGPGQPLSYIPGAPILVLSSGNPRALLSNLVRYAENAGLSQFDKPLRTLLDFSDGIVSDPSLEAAKPLADALDWTRQLVVAVYNDEQSGATSVFAHIPVQSASRALEEFQKAVSAPGASFKVSDALPGYVSLSTGPERLPSSPVQSLAGQALLAYPGNALAVWVDARAISQLSESFMPAIRGILNLPQGGQDGASSWNLDAEAGDGRPADNGQAPDAAEDAGAWLASLAEGVRGLDAAITASPSELWFSLNANLERESRMGKAALELSESEPSIPFLRYADAKSLVSAAWSMPPAWSKRLLEPIYEAAFRSSGDLMGKGESLFQAAAGLGNDGALSLGLGLSDDLTRRIRASDLGQSDAAAKEVIKGLLVDCSYVYRLSDRKEFRAYLAGLDETFTRSFSALGAEGKRVLVSAESGTDGSYPWDRVSLSLKAVKSNQPESMLDSVLGLVGSHTYWYQGDLAAGAIGASDEPKALLGRGRAESPLSDDKRFAASRTGMGPHTRFIMRVSIERLLELVSKVTNPETPPASRDATDFRGLYFWLSALRDGPGRLPLMGFGISLGAEDLKGFISLASGAQASQQ